MFRNLLSSYFRRSHRRFASVSLQSTAFLIVSLLAASSLNAHDEFKEALQQRYRLKSVSCKACHTDNKDKEIRNAFGKLLYNELKDKQITQQYRDAKAKGEEAEKKFKERMVKDFVIALKTVEQKPVTFLSLLEAGLLNGTRLDKNQVDVDALEIETLSDAKVKSVTTDEKNVIKGEIKRMPPEENRKAPPTAEPSTAEMKKPAGIGVGESNSDAQKPVEAAEPSAADPEHVPKAK